MRTWTYITLTCSAMSAQASLAATQETPVPAVPRQAHIAWISNVGKRCPDLRAATGEPAAVVIFLVDRAGNPSHVAIKSSSQSDALDAAATDCVAKLRFDPATRIGDGEAVDSWQQIGWSWASTDHRAALPRAATQTSASAAPEAASNLSGAQTQTAAGANAQHRENKVAVRVCADAQGKLLQDPTILSSSGEPAIDAAAVQIARSGSPYYRPAATLDGQSASGCARLAIEFE